MTTKKLTKEALSTCIEYYEQGNTLPDDIMQQLFYMAEREVDKLTFKEELDEMIIDGSRSLFEAEQELEESNSGLYARTKVENAKYALEALLHKRKFMFGE